MASGDWKNIVIGFLAGILIGAAVVGGLWYASAWD